MLRLPEKLYIDARTLLVDSVKLARRVWDDGFLPDCLIGVWRGGALPSISVHEFFRFRGRELCHVIVKAQSYAGMQRDGAAVELEGLNHVIDAIKGRTRVLVVDDVLDTGYTMAAIVNEIKARTSSQAPDCRVATVYYKPEMNEAGIEPDYYTIVDNRWIVFPHELEGLTEEELRIHRSELYEAALS